MKSNINLKIGLVQVVRELFALATGGEAATVSLLTTGSAMNRTTASASGLSAAMGKASTGLGAFMRFGGGVPAIAAVSAALWAGSKAWDIYTESQKTATDKAREYFGSLDGLADAIAKDTEAGDDSLRQFSVTLEDTAKSSFGLATELEVAADGTWSIKDASDETNQSLENQIVLMGELTKQAIAQKVTESISEDWENYGTTLRSVGFDIDEFMRKSLLMDGSAEKYAAGFEITTAEIERMGLAAQTAFADAQDVLFALEQSGTTSGAAYDEASSALARAQDARDKFFDSDKANIEGNNEAVREFVKAASLVEPAVEGAANGALLLAAGAKASGEELNLAVDGAEDFGNEVSSLTDKLKDFNSVASADIALADMFYDMGEALHKNGLEFNLFTQGGISNMQMLEKNINQMAVAAGDDSALFVGNVLSMMSALEDQGVQIGQEFDWVYQGLTNLVGPEYGINLNTAAARQNAINLINDLIAVERQIMAMNQLKFTQNPFMDPSRRGANFVDIPDNSAKLNGLINLQKNLTKAVDQSVPAASNLARGYDNAARNAEKTSKGAGKTAKNTNEAAKAAKDLAKEMRTSNDYAKDLAGVFGDINDLVFGMSDASGTVRENFQDLLEDLTKDAGAVQLDLFGFDRKEALDGILSTFYNLKQAAADAKKEVRDSLAAVQEAQAKLQSNKAESQTLEYQLMVAKALGSAERIAEIEAKIAENQAARVEATNDVADALERQKKAQEATSTSTGGSGEVDIANRDKLRKLAAEYMDYADLLRKAGVSTKDVGKYTKQAEKDFLAQGKALGFTDKQLELYAEGIAKSSGAIEANSTDLKTNEKALQDLYRSHVDAVTAFAATGATQKQVAEFAKQSERQFFSQAKQLGFNISELGKYRTAWDALHTTIKALPSQVTIRANVQNPSDAALKKFFTEWNNKQLQLKTNVNATDANNWKKANTGGRGISAPISTPVRAALDSNSVAKAGRGMVLLAQLGQRAATVMNLMRNPSLSNLTKIATNTAAAATLVSRLTSGNYASGGFTGRGGKFEPAGTVHKGEYVFTQAETNQTTGLPKTEALYAMLGKTMGLSQPSVSGEAMAYNPSPVNSNALTLVELLPNQMVQLAQLFGQYMPQGITPEGVALATNRINLARSGRGQG